ncbi:MAG: ABC transporter permease [Dehalococcoidales bacterium]|nr:ABC transporter permease [Dehalococcoidales bacterium]
MATETLDGTVLPKRYHFLINILRRLIKEKPMGIFGGIIVLVLLLCGIFADILAPYGMNEVDLISRLLPPSPQFLLGTDHLGRDLLSNIIYGARISVIIGISCACCSTIVSFVIGAVSGLLGGKFDMLVQRFVDAWMCIPSLLITITLMSIVGRGMLQIIIVISVTMGIVGSRVVRSAVIGIKGNTYVEAANVVGCSNFRLIMRHILPNILAPIIINFTLTVGQAIMIEASLSFLGFGVPPGVPSWGSMLSAEGRQYMERAPQLALYPGLALALTIYGINMFGDALRDLSDPRLRGGLGRYQRTQKVKQKIKELVGAG